MSGRSHRFGLSLATRLIADQRGLAAIEFALIAPIMIILYLGLTEFCQAYMAERRTSHTTAMVADLVAQSDKTTSEKIDEVFAIGQLIMKPFPADPLLVRVTSVTMNDTGVASVDWSKSNNQAAFPKRDKGDPVTDLPAGLISKDESLIIGETNYEYNSAFKAAMPGPIVFKRTYYLRPRTVNQVICPDC